MDNLVSTFFRFSFSASKGRNGAQARCRDHSTTRRGTGPLGPG
ncbi:hypothetical protein [Hymenobacter volaticus]|nr:hypothetical protein [Hymenobacter volaticus]